ncbi:MAG: hypothetical protein CENE_02673 [Candidatus Celerinatantimonas neptuna]|nr:MAG: hypothetical protein CENE_02673 [Candidatus Celerinatantimonas neptuna]
MINQQLKTVVTLGGTVDHSFTKMGSAFNQSMGKATGTVKQLKREQEQLTKKIKKAKLAGDDVSLLTRRYQELGQQVERSGNKVSAFERIQSAGSGFKKTAGLATAAAGSIWGTAAALTGMMTATNQETAATVGLAHAQSMSIEQFQAWNAIAKQADLSGENIGDMIEELSNKYGEFKALGQQSTVASVFGKLGITKDMMAGMNAAQQFEYVMKRLQHVKDQQQAASLADMLFGGEANKVVTYIRSTHKSLDSLLASQQRFNQLTNHGGAGAQRYGNAFKNLRLVIRSTWQEISGIVGGEMADDINKLSLQIGAFVRKNKAQIVSMMKSLIYSAKDAAIGLFHLGQTINHVVQFFGGWHTVGMAVATLLAGKLVMGIVSMTVGLMSAARTLGIAKIAMAAFNLVLSANPIGLIVTIIGLLIIGLVELYRHSSKVNKWIQSHFPKTVHLFKSIMSWSPMASLKKAWHGVTGFFSHLLNGIVGWFRDGWLSIKQAFFNWIPLGLLISHWDGVRTYFSDLWSGIQSRFSHGIDHIQHALSFSPRPTIKAAWDDVVHYFQNLWQRISGIFYRGMARIQAVFGHVKHWFGKLKFWHHDPSPKSVHIRKTIETIGTTQQASSATAASRVVPDPAQRAQAAIQKVSVKHQAVHVQQNVGGITIYAAPGQSPEDIGQAVHQTLTDHLDSALYDLPEF